MSKPEVWLVEAKGDDKFVYTPDWTVKARALVLATGAMGRKPSIKGEEDFLGKGVSYCATSSLSRTAILGDTQPRSVSPDRLNTSKVANGPSKVAWVARIVPLGCKYSHFFLVMSSRLLGFRPGGYPSHAYFSSHGN